MQVRVLSPTLKTNIEVGAVTYHCRFNEGVFKWTQSARQHLFRSRLDGQASSAHIQAVTITPSRIAKSATTAKTITARTKTRPLSSVAERRSYKAKAGGSVPPAATVTERRSDESGRDPGRRGGGTLQSPQGSLAER
jgi:hypothetical protein